MGDAINKRFTQEQKDELLRILKNRFDKNMTRHKDIEWIKVENKLANNDEKLWSIYRMEETGGEPDVVGYDINTDEYIFFDCSKESPKGRRSVCYDRKALESRKKHKPETSAMDMAREM